MACWCVLLPFHALVPVHEVMLTLFVVLWCVRSHHCALPSRAPVSFLLTQSLVMRYGKESDKVATAVAGVKKMVDKVRGGEGRGGRGDGEGWGV